MRGLFAVSEVIRRYQTDFLKETFNFHTIPVLSELIPAGLENQGLAS